MNIAEAKKAINELEMEAFQTKDGKGDAYVLLSDVNRVVTELEKSVRDKRDQARKSAPPDGYYTGGIRNAVEAVVLTEVLGE